MKFLIITCLICFLFTAAYAQDLKETEVPTAVKSAFTKAFPKVKAVKWSKESESEFEAEFNNEGREVSANFSVAGAWVVTETEIKKTELPAALRATIKKEFVGYEIEETEKVEIPGKPLFYEVELEKGSTTYSLQFSGDGKILKKEKKERD